MFNTCAFVLCINMFGSMVNELQSLFLTPIETVGGDPRDGLPKMQSTAAAETRTPNSFGKFRIFVILR